MHWSQNFVTMLIVSQQKIKVRKNDEKEKTRGIVIEPKKLKIRDRYSLCKIQN